MRSRFPRRGVILLIVLSLLALFILMGVTFTLSVSQYHHASRLEQKDQQYGDLPETEMDLVLGQILYDSAARTVLQYHSLLRDLYGSDSVEGVVDPPPSGFPLPLGYLNPIPPPPPPSPPPPPQQTGQFFRFVAKSSPGFQFVPIPGFYAGRVITFRTGRAANHSTRIVDYDYDFTTKVPIITIEAIESKLAGPLSPSLGDHFLINGAPFNGTGAGYDPTTGKLDLQYWANDPTTPGNYLTPVAASLVPNIAAYFGQLRDSTGTPPSSPETGGFDESWDAVDLQNLFLAMVPPEAAERYQKGDYSLPIIPSFHRPELVYYWWQYCLSNPSASSLLSQPDFLRTFIFRPMPWDHPYFTGSNPFFARPPMGGLNNSQLLMHLSGYRDLDGDNQPDDINGDGTPDFYPLWDVDNDNDGYPDSIWIDPGLPVITMPDGRRVKRLAAILIKDLDGSIDVNAHGNLDQAVNPYSHADYGLQPGMAAGYTPLPGYAVGLAPAGSVVPRGAGFGPADVNFLGLLANNNPPNPPNPPDPPTSDTVAVQAYRQILARRYESKLAGDYIGSPTGPRPGYPGVRDPSARFVADPRSRVQLHAGVPDEYKPGQGMWYASPPDVWGRKAIVLDVGGQPLWVNTAVNPALGPEVKEVKDCPYELSLSGEFNNADTPYTAAELERLLRYHDPDAVQLPGRLLEAATVGTPTGSDNPLWSRSLTLGKFNVPGLIDESHSRRNMLTTMTSHLPVPPGLPPPERRGTDSLVMDPAGSRPLKLAERAGQSTILELYATVLVRNGVALNNLRQAMWAIVPWEFFHGQKLDLNRWLGDGQDNDNNGAIDDPSEAAIETFPPTPLPPSIPPIQANLTNGNLTNGRPPDPRQARQLLARHLFCLAMLLGGDTFQPPPPPSGSTLAPPQLKRLATLRLAQWAINCVDFRDADAIMTPFEFDYEPFTDNDGNPNNGTWDVDGKLDATSSDNVAGWRGLVWGMEAPDLLITETLAFHDRRVKDTRYDSSGKDRNASSQPDEDLDQFRIPQGSLFVELYCPRAREQGNQKPLLPRELYDANGLILGASPTGRSPIWRLALQKLSKNRDPVHPMQTLETNPELASMDPFNPYLMPTSGAPPITEPQVDRYAYFGDYISVSTTGDIDRSYYLPSGAQPRLEPGQYAVVGPREVTFLGSVQPDSGSLWQGPSQQKIVLNPVVDVRDTANQSTLPAAGVRPARGIVLAMFGAPGNPVVPNGSGWSNPPPWPLGLNVTEPLPSGNYYPKPFTTRPGGFMAPPDFVYDFYLEDPNTPTSPGTLPDVPLESPGGAGTAGRPIADQQMAATGTYLDCSAVWLQRLADPTQRYNPPPPDPGYNPTLPVNPYITVDWLTIDVTVFSGEEDTTRTANSNQPIDPDDPNPRNANLFFRSRQRGFPQGAYPVPTTPYYRRSNPWPPVTYNGDPYPKTPLQALGAGLPYFNVDLSNNLAPSPPMGPPYDPAIDRHTLGYLNKPVEQVGALVNPTVYGSYPGEPNYPFPWLTWNNRPFTSPMELLLVPASTPGRMLLEFSTLNTGPSAPGTVVESFWTMTPSTPPYAIPDPYDMAHFNGWRSPYLHLLNFFHSAQISSDPSRSPFLYRLLEYVEVPSPYQGAERYYNPTAFANDATRQYYPPFCKLSRFRDAGRVNLNTIFDSRVWDALVSRFPGLYELDSQYPGFFTQHLAISRQGYSASLYSLDPQYPTRFANPFRSSHSADLMPNIASGTGTMRKDNPVEATFLRPELQDPQKPLFQVRRDDNRWYDPNGPGQPPPPGPPAGSNGLHQDIHRNPYFRYQALQKLGNLVSTQSNCFAVWITIGYFEVYPVTVDSAHPDGYALSQEVGLDSGQVVRHRGFFIIDRSVPVGFSPGSRLNTDDCVLVRRLIE